MTRNYKDWTIEIVELMHPDFGRGYRATAYIRKDNGLKTNILEVSRFDGISNQTHMLEYTKRLLEL